MHLTKINTLIGWYRLTSGFRIGNRLYRIISFNLLIFVGMVLIMALFKGVFMFFMRQTIIVVSRHIEYDLKNEIFNQYQRLDQNFYNTNNTGDLMNRISEDVSRGSDVCRPCCYVHCQPDCNVCTCYRGNGTGEFGTYLIYASSFTGTFICNLFGWN